MIRLSLVPAWLRIVLASSLVAGAALGLKAWRESIREEGRAQVRAEWTAERERQKDAALKQAEANAKETERRLAAQKDAQDAYDKEMARLRADAAAARGAADRLRQQVSAFTAAYRGAASYSATLGQRPPAGSPLDLLAKLLGESEERAGVLALALDRSYAAGRQCEREADALTVNP